MHASPVTVYEAIKFNLCEWSVFESMIFKKYVHMMSYNVAEYFIGSVLNPGTFYGEFLPLKFQIPQK